MARTGSPAVRDVIDSTGRILRRLAASAWSPAVISAAKAAMARCAGRTRMCLRFGLTKRGLILIPCEGASASDAHKRLILAGMITAPACPCTVPRHHARVESFSAVDIG